MYKIIHRASGDVRASEIKELRAGSWILVEETSREELTELADKLSLDKAVLLDGLDPYEVPRLEMHEGVGYVFTRYPLASGEEQSTWPILFIISSQYLITISTRKLAIFDDFLIGKIDYSTTERAKLLVQLFSRINREYFSAIQAVSKTVRALRVALDKVRDEDIIHFVRSEEVLGDYLSALSAASAMLSLLLSGKHLELQAKDKELVEDTLLAKGQLIEIAQASLKNIGNIRAAYTAVLSQRLNNTIKTLTVLTVVLNVPVLVASFYGMNVSLPGEGYAHSFALIVSTSLLVSVALLYFMTKRPSTR